MAGDFEGSSVIITGAGSGIGRATALMLASRGAKVLVVVIIGERAEAVAAEIGNAGGTSLAVVGDVSEQSVVDRVVSSAVTAHGTVDVLINNAGIMDTMTATDEVSDAEWDRIIAVNLTAPFRMTRAVAPIMLAKGKGAIVNLASVAGLGGSAAGTAYTVSKHGVVGLTRSSSVMYRGKGVRVNAVAPGAVDTNIGVTPAEDALGPAVIHAYWPNVSRIAHPDELAAVIAFLASDAASNITGAIVPVDDGWGAL
ncbi:MAG: SDR family oxidoreductase [bacterium]|nr:SDR family oxidoreductase [bacterium]